ncbi:MAG: hypothetical protein U5O39_16310 [Gammaproteobacteria bacterium]|nr:hypothetical protein [Gammaproteobacteria bacterium]
MEDISEMGHGDPSYSRAFDINNEEQIVGEIARDDALNYGDTDRFAFIWEEGTFTYLAHLPGHSNSTAVAINEVGQATGWSGDAADIDTTAVFWSNDQVSSIGVLDADINSRALAVNENGQVVGTALKDTERRAVLLTPLSRQRVLNMARRAAGPAVRARGE